MTIETSAARMEPVRADQLRVGDRVRIKPPEEILTTLDGRARVDGLPFMPEMLAFAGRTLTVDAVTRRTRPEALARLASLTGGTVVPVAPAAEVARGVLAARPPRVVAAPVHPLRSPWWAMVFVASLGGEWWLRRRAGQR